MEVSKNIYRERGRGDEKIKHYIKVEVMWIVVSINYFKFCIKFKISNEEKYIKLVSRNFLRPYKISLNFFIEFVML